MDLSTFTYCLRDTGLSKVTIATFYYYAKESGVELKSQQSVKLENIAKMAKKQGRAQESVVEIARLHGMDVEKATETAAAVYEALVQKGWSAEELPTVRTISNILNRLDYRLRTVAKTKVQKKRLRRTRSSRTFGA